MRIRGIYGGVPMELVEIDQHGLSRGVRERGSVRIPGVCESSWRGASLLDSWLDEHPDQRV